MPPVQNKKSDLNQISHYSLQEQLVEQAVSAIYRAKDEKTGSTVFLVTLRPEAVTGDLPDRFLRRAETAAQLEHKNILPLLEYGTAEKRPFATFPYQPGEFLANHPDFQAEPTPDNKSQVIKAIELVAQLAAALAVAHPTGLIHHNLRPENIYLNEVGQPFLLDLVVPPTPPAAMPANGEPPRELDYTSPEQLAGKTLSGRSNVFSLGVLLYRLLAGKLPPLPVSEWDIFEHKGMAREVPLQELRPGLTQATYTAVQDSIWQKEWSRYETAAAQQKALEQAKTAEAAPPPPPPPVWLVWFRKLSQPQVLKFAVPALLVIVLLLLALFFLRGSGRQNGGPAPTPETVVLPVEEEPIEQTIPTPTATAAEGGTPVEQEQDAEVIPATATDLPTATEPATETAVPATPTNPPTTDTPEPTPTLTNTPTTEPTEVTSCVPSPPFGWVRYTIRANDSLSAIGQATNTTVEQLQEVNCLEGTLLSVGQEIWVRFSPVATDTPVPATAVPGTATPPPSGPNPTSPPPTPPTPTPPITATPSP